MNLIIILKYLQFDFENAELQIHIDIPRMNPLVAIFQQKLVQEVSTLL